MYSDETWWERGEKVLCPVCGVKLEYDEAGRVPGARRCANGHKCQLSSDGTEARVVD